jgi:outer membrane protein assembly factor BamB
MSLEPQISADPLAWTRFRGPNGAGVNRTAAIPIVVSEENYLWRTKLPGIGHSSPVIWGDGLFVTSADETSGDRFVTCLDCRSGNELWTKKFAAAPHQTHQLNSLASPTPVVDSDRVYVAWGTPERITVRALSHNGEDAWDADLGPYSAGHGFGQSLCLHGDLIILPVEKGEGSFRIALQRDSGQVAWKIVCDSSLHYATPCVRSTNAGDELIFVNWEQGIVGVDPSTGDSRWAADVFDKGHIESSIASPVLARNFVIGVAGWLGHGYEAIAVDPGRTDDKVVWKLDRGAPLCTTPLVVEDLVFFWADNGAVTCVDAATGKVHWRERVGSNFYSSPICAGDAVYNISTDGELVVLAAKRDYELLARNNLGEASHATPAVAADRMYVRTVTQVLCIGAANPAR